MTNPLRDAVAGSLFKGSLPLSPQPAMRCSAKGHEEHSTSKRKNKAGNKMPYAVVEAAYIAP
jgi:hypothetical protein